MKETIISKETVNKVKGILSTLKSKGDVYAALDIYMNDAVEQEDVNSLQLLKTVIALCADAYEKNHKYQLYIQEKLIDKTINGDRIKISDSVKLTIDEYGFEILFSELSEYALNKIRARVKNSLSRELQKYEFMILDKDFDNNDEYSYMIKHLERLLEIIK